MGEERVGIFWAAAKVAASVSWPSHAAIALTSPASLTETLDYGAGSTACLFSILAQRTHYPVELTTIHFINIYDPKT